MELIAPLRNYDTSENEIYLTEIISDDKPRAFLL